MPKNSPNHRIYPIHQHHRTIPSHLLMNGGKNFFLFVENIRVFIAYYNCMRQHGRKLNFWRLNIQMPEYSLLPKQEKK